MMTQAATEAKTRSRRRTQLGVVTANKCDKTIRVELYYTRPHSKYSKIIRQRTQLYAHDEKNEARIGDTVELAECRRMSKTKAWRLVRVVRKAPEE